MKHYTLEHNVYSYLAFIVYIRNKKPNDCNGIEKHVKKMIDENQINFFPTTAISIKDLPEDDAGDWGE